MRQRDAVSKQRSKREAEMNKKKEKKEFAQIAKLTGDSDGDVASGSDNESERALANLFTSLLPLFFPPRLLFSISLPLCLGFCCSAAAVAP